MPDVGLRVTQGGWVGCFEDREEKGTHVVARFKVYIYRGTIGMWIRGIRDRREWNCGVLFPGTCLILSTNLG